MTNNWFKKYRLKLGINFFHPVMCCPDSPAIRNQFKTLFIFQINSNEVSPDGIMYGPRPAGHLHEDFIGELLGHVAVNTVHFKQPAVHMLQFTKS